MSNIRDWFTAAASNGATPPDGEPEGMDRTDVNNAARERAAALKVFYDNPDWRRPFEDYVLTGSDKSFVLTDGAVEADASLALKVGQRMRIVKGGGSWEGFITSVVQSPFNVCTVLVTDWDPAVSTDTDGPTPSPPDYIEVGPKELGSAAWAATGTDPTDVPTIADLDPHVLIPEADLDVGLLDGNTHDQIEEKAARGRLNMNGGMDVWQRGTTFDGALANNNDGDVTADGFVIISDGNDMVDVSRVAADQELKDLAPVQYYMKLSAQPAGNAKHGIIHISEGEDTGDVAVAGTTKKMSVSFLARIGAVGGIDNLRVAVINLRTGLPLLHPVAVWNSGSPGALTFEASEWQLVTGQTPEGSQQITLTGVWQIFTIDGLDMDMAGGGVGNGGVALAVTVDEAVIGANMEWHFAGVQFNRGAHSMEFMRQPAAVERARCQRYYQSTVDEEIAAPAHGIGIEHALIDVTTNVASPNAFASVSFLLTPKYKLPTVVTYNFVGAPGTPGDDWSDGAADPGGSFDIAATTVTRKLIHMTCTEASQKTILGIIIACHANIWGNN